MRFLNWSIMKFEVFSLTTSKTRHKMFHKVHDHTKHIIFLMNKNQSKLFTVDARNTNKMNKAHKSLKNLSHQIWKERLFNHVTQAVLWRLKCPIRPGLQLQLYLDQSQRVRWNLLILQKKIVFDKNQGILLLNDLFDLCEL